MCVSVLDDRKGTHGLTAPLAPTAGPILIFEGQESLPTLAFSIFHVTHRSQRKVTHPGAMQCCSLLAPAVPLARRPAAFSSARTQLLQPLRTAQASLSVSTGSRETALTHFLLVACSHYPNVLHAASGTTCCTSGGGEQQQWCGGSSGS